MATACDNNTKLNRYRQLDELLRIIRSAIDAEYASGGFDEAFIKSITDCLINTTTAELYEYFYSEERISSKLLEDEHYILQSTTYFGIICVKRYFNIHNHTIVVVMDRLDKISITNHTDIHIYAESWPLVSVNSYEHLRARYDRMFCNTFDSTFDELIEFASTEQVLFEMIISLIILERHVRETGIDVNSVYSDCIDPEQTNIVNYIQSIEFDNEWIPRTPLPWSVYQLASFLWNMFPDITNNIIVGESIENSAISTIYFNGAIMTVMACKNRKTISTFEPEFTGLFTDKVVRRYCGRSINIDVGAFSNRMNKKFDPVFTIGELYDAKFGSSEILRNYMKRYTERDILLYMFISSVIYDKIAASLG